MRVSSPRVHANGSPGPVELPEQPTLDDWAADPAMVEDEIAGAFIAHESGSDNDTAVS